MPPAALEAGLGSEAPKILYIITYIIIYISYNIPASPQEAGLDSEASIARLSLLGLHYPCGAKQAIKRVSKAPYITGFHLLVVEAVKR